MIIAEEYLNRSRLFRGGKQTIQPGDRAALKRWLLILRTTSTIAPPVLPADTPQEQIFAEFGDYLRSEGLVPHHPVPLAQQFNPVPP
jgi:hypothetical protein